jgi:predicted nucleic acid-binding protein
VTALRVVLDANILIRAVLGVQAREIIERHADTVAFFAPALAFDEARRHLPKIAGKQDVDPAPLLASLDRLAVIVELVPSEMVTPYESAAIARIGSRDRMDWPILATALALDCPLWTEDRDFFGVGIPTWTSARVGIYLSGATTPATQCPGA